MDGLKGYGNEGMKSASLEDVPYSDDDRCYLKTMRKALFPTMWGTSFRGPMVTHITRPSLPTTDGVCEAVWAAVIGRHTHTYQLVARQMGGGKQVADYATILRGLKHCQQADVVNISLDIIIYR